MSNYGPLQLGDEIRVIAPATAWQQKNEARYRRTADLLEGLGYKVSFGQLIQDRHRFVTGSVEARLADLHEAYRDPNVRAILALHGGWAANALLPYIDWQLLRANPKPFIGFSDITVLLNAIYAKTGNVGYLGPNFSTLSYERVRDYTLDNLQAVLQATQPYELTKSKRWEKHRNEKLVRTQTWQVLQSGQAAGTLLGGNVGTFYLLQGTEYQPQFTSNTILALEDDAESGKYTAREFDRRVESMLQLPGLRKNLRGIMVGRFEAESRVTMPDVVDIIHRLGIPNVPVIAGVDFGHTAPLLTLPIGGKVELIARQGKPSINLLEY